MMEVQKELKAEAIQLQKLSCSSSLVSGCELFIRFVTRAFLDIPVSKLIIGSRFIRNDSYYSTCASGFQQM